MAVGERLNRCCDPLDGWKKTLTTPMQWEMSETRSICEALLAHCVNK
jgi:hypothetical protein